MEAAFRTKKDNGRKHPERDAAALARRQKEVKDRAAAWKSLTPEQQLASLDARLGPGVGAKKQRLKILERMSRERAAAPKKASVIPELTEAVDQKRKKKAKERRAEEQGLRPWRGGR